MDKALLFLTVTKVDAVKREVSGFMTGQTPDKALEAMDYDTSKPHFQKWSDTLSKASAGKNLGNVRAMHGKVAAGQLVDIQFNDAEKVIGVTAKITDDAEWLKCEAGTYTGFSIGGDYVGKKWDDPDNPGVKRYTVNPCEVSIVDNPCWPGAHFTAVKADGMTEQRPLVGFVPTNEEVFTKAAELAKAAGDETKAADFIEAGRAALLEEHGGPATEKADEPAAEAASAPEATDTPPEAEKAATGDEIAPVPVVEPEPAMEIVQRWIAPDGKQFEKKADAAAHLADLAAVKRVGGPSALAAALAKAKAAMTPDAEAAPAGSLEEAGAAALKWAKVAEEAVKAFEPMLVRKSMWQVRELASVLMELSYITTNAAWERKAEGDESAVPDDLKAALAALASTLVAMTQEEVAEMLAEVDQSSGFAEVLVPYIELAEAATVLKADTALMEKVGARNSKQDAAKIQAMHDHAVTLGAACVEKVVTPEPENDPEVLKATVNRLQKEIDEAAPEVIKLVDEMGLMKARLAKLEKEPAPMPQLQRGTTAADKTGDTAIAAATDLTPMGALKAMMEELGPDAVKKMMFDLALSKPFTPAL